MESSNTENAEIGINPKPVFELSIEPLLPLPIFFVAFAIINGVAILFAVTFSFGATYSIIGIVAIDTLLGMTFAISMLVSYTNASVREAKFYEDHFELSVNGMEVNAPYSAIEKIIAFEPPHFWNDGRFRLLFKVKGSSGVFQLPQTRAAQNMLFEKDLATWIHSKNPDVQVPELP